MAGHEYQYFTGTPKEVGIFTGQLDHLYTREGLVVIGSVGRAAMYANYDFAAPALPLWNQSGQPRDIDVLLPNRLFYDEDDAPGPHRIDDELAAFFEQEMHRTVIYNGFTSTELDQAIFETHTRILQGSRVHTYKVGTQLELERFFASAARMDLEYYDAAKHVQSLETFTAFTEGLRHTHPEEFLPSELYQPLREIM